MLSSIYSVRQTCGRTSRGHTGGRSHRISPDFFCGACLNFLSREGFSRPFPSSTVLSNFVYPRNNCSPFVGHDVKENPSSRVYVVVCVVFEAFPFFFIVCCFSL